MNDLESDPLNSAASSMLEEGNQYCEENLIELEIEMLEEDDQDYEETLIGLEIEILNNE